MGLVLSLYKRLLRKLTVAEVDTNFESLETEVNKLGGYSASQTPGANQLPVTKADSSIALPGNVTMVGRLVGGFGASTSGGIQDWNDASNIIAGFGPVLLFGNSTNGPNTSPYSYHVMNLNYGPSKDASNSITQIAIPYYYASPHLYLRSRYQGAWTAWRQIPLADIAGRIMIGEGTVNSSGAKLQTADGLTFPATQVPCADPNTLDDYREPTFTATATGMTTSPTGTIEFVKAGKMVIMQIPAIAGISNTTTFTLTGMPTTCRPSVPRTVILRITDNGVDSFGLAVIGTDGVITLYPTAAGGAFTSAGNKGVKTTNMSYLI